MKQQPLMLTAIMALTAALTGQPAVADVYMKHERHSEPFTIMGQTQPGKTQTTVTWLGEGRSRSDQAATTSVIVDAVNKAMYILNHQRRIYMAMPLDLREAIGERAAKAGLQGQRAQKAMQGMAEGMMKFDTKVTPTDETKKIGEWNTRKYLVETTMGMGATKSESWATEDIKADVSGYWRTANAAMGAEAGDSDMLNEMAKIKGVVVLSISQGNVMGAETKTTERLIEIADKPAPPGIYEVPPDYTKSEGAMFR